MKEQFVEYKKWLEANGLAKKTIKNYMYNIKAFARKANMKNLTEEELVNYVLLLKETHKGNSINTYFSTVKSFLNFKNIDIRTPKALPVLKKIPEYITLKEFEEKLIPIIDSKFKQPMKPMAVLYFMFYTGLRKEEVTFLQRKNFDFENNSAKIILNKQNKEKIIFYPDKVKDFCKNYFIFEEENKNAFNVSIDKINYMFRKLKPYFEEINIKPHLLRHSFGTYLRSIGWTLDQIQKAMGHSSRSSTEIYAHIEELDIKELYKKTVDKKDGKKKKK